MKKIPDIFPVFFLLVIFSACSGKQSEPWEADQLMPPAELAALIDASENSVATGDSSTTDGSSTIEDSAAELPMIVCIGPGALIPGSKDVGQTGEEPNLGKLRTLLSEEDRDRDIVLYCGCCPFERCPNIRPAFSLLNEMNFTNHRLLNLSTNLKTDWIEKGYPVVH